MTPERERLVLDAMPMLDRLVRFFLSRRPAHLDGDAVRGAAHEALVKAAGAFDPGRGVPFEAWAYQRILGSMLDEVRSLSFGPRGERIAVLAIQPWDAMTEVADEAGARLDLYAALAELSPATRRLVLAFFAGYQLQELGDELGITDSAVCFRKRGAHRRLRAALAA